MRSLPILGLVACAPYVTRDDLRDATDPCAWSVAHAGRGALAAASSPCDARWVVSGAAVHDALGGSLAAVGDVDGDGRDDLAVGAPDALDRRGTVHVFLASTLASTGVLRSDRADHVIVGAQPGDEAGAVYTSLDSRDGADGRELVIAAPGDDQGGADAGAVVVVSTVDLGVARSLGLDGLTTVLLGRSRMRAGSALAVIDSTDGDGFEELVIGAPHASMGATESGTVFVAHSSRLAVGEATVLGDASAGLLYVTADAAFGDAVAAFDGDPSVPGATGLLVGAPRYPHDDGSLGQQVDGGRAWLFGDAAVPPPGTLREVLEPFSAFAVSLRAETVVSYEEEELRWRDDDARIGSRVAVVPDMDGGGLDELVIAGAYDAPGDVVAFVVRGEDLVGELGGLYPIEDRAAVRVVSTGQGVSGVPTIAGVHDLDGDGRGELMIGDPHGDGEGAVDGGRVYVHTSSALFGEPAGGQRTVALDDAWRSLQGDAPGARFGAAVAEVGDLDGDGIPEIAIGAPGRRGAAGAEVGRVLVYAGGH